VEFKSDRSDQITGFNASFTSSKFNHIFVPGRFAKNEQRKYAQQETCFIRFEVRIVIKPDQSFISNVA